MRADVYTRLSRDREDQTSTARQARDCRSLVEARGWELGEVHEDVDFSAFRRGVVRPAYELLRRRVEAGEVQAVVVWKIDRLSRSLRDFLDFADLCDRHGVALVSVHEPFDTSSPIGRAIMQVLAVFAELEAATIGLRVSAARRQAAREGRRRPGGRRPWCYEPDMAVRPEEAALAREAASRLIAGESLGAICRSWAAAGHTAPSGRPWTESALARRLRSPHLAGLLTQGDDIAGPGGWEPVLEPDLWRQVRAVLDARRNRVTTTSRRQWALSGGLLTCGKCGAALIGQRRADGAGRYRCSSRPQHGGCGGLSIVAAPVEDFVGQVVAAALEGQELGLPAADSTTGGELLAELRVVEERLADAGRAYARGRLSLDAFEAASQELEANAAELRRRIGHAGGVDLSKVAARWGRDPQFDHQAAAAIFDRIEVLPVERRGAKPAVADRLRFHRRSI